jgi:hypothetical protein
MCRRRNMIRPAIAHTRQDECHGRWRETRKRARRTESASRRRSSDNVTSGWAPPAGWALPRNGARRRNGIQRSKRAQARHKAASMTAIRSRCEKPRYLPISHICGRTRGFPTGFYSLAGAASDYTSPRSPAESPFGEELAKRASSKGNKRIICKQGTGDAERRRN